MVNVKVCFVGSSGVGKTCLINRTVNNSYLDTANPTVGASYMKKEVEVDGKQITLDLWDTAGQERYRALAPSFFRGSSVIVIVYSIIDATSFDDLRDWYENIQTNCNPIPRIIVVGSKADLHETRLVPSQQAENFAKSINVDYFEVSALSGAGIEELMLSIATQLDTSKSEPETPSKIVVEEKPKKKKRFGCF
ncbi:small GTP-binding protein, putative [Trichomonas vaginalis G3]|uniref:Small GTP-binding protein, putative n=1 Tax=Trichomonas vaginalis (strain ATCC PRA-98 / G3) TaxID=412133 RepID=A2E9N3_TRIV3|nr:Rab GTPase [Trichomonas vaginalis G3]EAY10684.1 small GTP-binding protein, putative [Trichomonas vaginalis G3]KAI5512174.1 Rab GTPase [Trichomonas vaginalis G3]|eukprot:XP_001322907.1 small GTP-binding protein [Trichomonas vaginalis G3]